MTLKNIFGLKRRFGNLSKKMCFYKLNELFCFTMKLVNSSFEHFLSRLSLSSIDVCEKDRDETDFTKCFVGLEELSDGFK